MSETWDGYTPDFVERNGAWLLSVFGIVGTCVSAMSVYFLKSRCSSIKCCGIECQRDVLDLTQVELDRPSRVMFQQTPQPSSDAV